MLFLFSSMKILFAQIEVKGTVLFDRTPVENVSVFLNNTTIGTTTDKNGQFNLNIPKGNYELIISHLGFKTVVHKLNTETYNKPLAFSLNEDDILLDEVVVKGTQNNKNWAFDFVVFRDNFIGISELSKQCKILNPKVLHFIFNVEENKLTAYAKAPLHIKNEALGYEISYDLKSFTKQNNYVHYLGYAQFKELKGGKRKQKLWKKNRLKAYYGSITHFYKSLLNNTTKQDGFVISLFERKENPNRPSDEEIKKAQNIIAKTDAFINFSKEITTPQNAEDSAMLVLERARLPKLVDYLYKSDISPSEIISKKEGQTFLDFNNNLLVVYTKEQEELKYILQGAFSKPRKPLAQTSNIIPQAMPSLIMSDGILQEPLSMLYEGYWSYEKFAHTLPLDYTPLE